MLNALRVTDPKKPGRPVKLVDPNKVTVRLPGKLTARLNKLSASTGKSKNDLLIEAFQDWYDRHPDHDFIEGVLARGEAPSPIKRKP